MERFSWCWGTQGLSHCPPRDVPLDPEERHRVMSCQEPSGSTDLRAFPEWAFLRLQQTSPPSYPLPLFLTLKLSWELRCGRELPTLPPPPHSLPSKAQQGSYKVPISAGPATPAVSCPLPQQAGGQGRGKPRAAGLVPPPPSQLGDLGEGVTTGRWWS